jgi:glycosyltransferase involved in cell wall biosynthesis
MHESGEAIGTIGIPVRDHLSAATTTALMMTDLSRSWIPPERSVFKSIVQGNNLVLARNELVQRMQGDWLLFIDDDMVWEPDAVRRLVAAREELDLDMLGALCFRRSPPYQPTLYMREGPDKGAYNFLEKWESDVIEVDATGMAFIIIHKRVFERMAGSPMPSLEERIKLGPPNVFRWQGVLGEDLRFCQEAKASGSRVFVDTRIPIGHVSERIITHRDFLMELALRPIDVLVERIRINNEMGFPTMGRGEAMEALGLDVDAG